MDEVVIPPSPNWYLHSVFVCAPDNTVIYGSRRDIVIINPRDPSEAADIQIIYSAHNDRVTGVSINGSTWGNPNKYLVSVSDDRKVKLWDLSTNTLKNQHSGHEENSDTVVGVSFVGERVVSVSEMGHIMVWRLDKNTVHALPDIFGQRVKISCMSSCPHALWLTAFGLQNGLVIIADLRQNGRVLHKLRGNENEVTSLAWCPLPYNIYKTAQGIRIENALKTKTENRKYTKENTGNVKSKDIPEQTETSSIDVPVQESDQSQETKPTTESELEQIEKKINDISINNSKEVHENINAEYLAVESDASSETVTEEKPEDIQENSTVEEYTEIVSTPDAETKKVRKPNVYQKVDKKNPWGNVVFNDSDEEDPPLEESVLPDMSTDFLKECQHLRKAILGDDDDDIFASGSEVLNNKQAKIEETTEGNTTGNESNKAGPEQANNKNENKPTFAVDYESTSTENIKTNNGQVDPETIHTVESKEESEEKKIEQSVKESTSNDESEVADTKNLKDAAKTGSETVSETEAAATTTETEDIDLDDETCLEKEYLLASACRGGLICIWRALTDCRLQIMLPSVNSNKAGGRRDDKRNRWISICWPKPFNLLSSSQANDVYVWNLLPKVDGKKRITKNQLFKPRLVHGDHRRSIFSIATPFQFFANKEAQSNWRTETDMNVWTMSMDRWVLCTNLGVERKTIASYPCFGGTVTNIAVSSLDPNKVALGVGDPSVRIWDLSCPQKQVITMTCLWDKVKSRLSYLDWHPVKENFLAFATIEGRVGEFDVCNVSKPPVIFSNYHRTTVHKIQWGPIKSDTDDICGLYSCSGGELIIHNAMKPNAGPINIDLEENRVTTFSWKSDYSMLAIGTKEGIVKLLSNEFVLLGTLYMQKRAVQCVAWHPLSTASDTGISPFANDLAVSTNECTIFVYRCIGSDGKQEDGDTPNKLIATLTGHRNSVKGLAWCPHVGGRLASCSDDGSAMIWDVQSQTLLSTFRGHCNDSILCIAWNPLDADLILTGGKDCTLRIWRITKHPPVLVNKEEKTKKKPVKSSKLPSEKEIDSDSSDVILVKSSSKNTKPNLLPSVSKLQNPEVGLTMETCRQLLELLDISVKDDSSTSDSDDEEFDENEKEGQVAAMSSDPIKLFSTKKDMMMLLNFEQNAHINRKQWENAHHISLWKGDLAKTIEQSLKAGIINPWIISIAPMVSQKLWSELCLAYGEKLAEEKQGLLASSYFLACHKVPRAIEVLCQCDMYREALALAQCRLPSSDTIIPNILERWAKFATYVGNYEIAAQCYIKLGRLSEAGELLNKRSDIQTLKMAAELASRAENTDLLSAVNTKLSALKITEPIVETDNIAPSRFDAMMADIRRKEQFQVLEDKAETPDNLMHNKQVAEEPQVSDETAEPVVDRPEHCD